ncbi:MAG TPA: AMP-binding protein [Gaiellales bacterium]|jgi:acyl-CoA synthetase (AMP-forming)/AMP-acid ligase II|nr:AMP-binding protein [Gaiellales bacterium]
MSTASITSGRVVPESLLELIDPDRETPALVSPEDGAEISHAALRESVLDLGERLRSAGADPGGRVAVVLPNGPEIVQVLLAIAGIGAAAAPLNPAYTEPEYRFYLDDLAPQLLVAGAGAAGAARAAAPGLPVVEVTAPANGSGLHAELHGRQLTRTAGADGGAEDIALLLHTSGTTSRPKQVPLLQRNLTSQARSIARHYLLGPGDVSYCAMPLFHVHGLVASTLAQLAAGGAVVTPRRFSPRRFWGQARTHAISWLSAGPTLHGMILEHPGTPPASLRFARSCSSALPPQLMREAEARYGVPMIEAYGMTEAGHQMTSNPLPPGARREGSVGVPAGAEVRVVDPAGVDVPAGEPGEVAIRGAGLTPGYLNNPEANAAAFFDDWFRTGDEGVLDDGYLRLRGRLKEMILRGGENISPHEIESVLVAHPHVAEAVAFGVDDEKYGQTVAAAVVLTGAASPEELRRYARESLAAFKVPDRIHVLDEIPKTPTGKVQRSRMPAHLDGGS